MRRIDHIRRGFATALIALCAALATWTGGVSAARADGHGIAMHGDPRYPPDFPHFSYADPAAPRGGALHLGWPGSFDSLNPLIVKGVSAQGIRDYVYESLMARALDEPFSLYGLLAERVRVPDDRNSITFTLRPEARFSDGEPVTADDVIFSHAMLRDEGRPNHRHYYAKVTEVEKLDERTVRFTFSGDGDREMPLIMGLMPVLPSHLLDRDSFTRTSLAAPVGSGPYTVARVDAGSRIVYRRDPDYWGRDLAANKGRFNFDTVTYTYFRDENAMFEAFRKGLIDVFPDNDPLRWTSGFDFPAAREERIVKDEIPYATPAGMSALVFNTRREMFAGQKVRKALIALFNGTWINENLFRGAFRRIESYYDPSELAASSRPASVRERELLAPWLDELPPSLLDGTFHLPAGDRSGHNRENRRAALKLLNEAGYRLEGNRVVHGDTGAPLSFEIMVATREQERLALVYARALKLAGITARVRQVDSTQYQTRRQTFDFDMMFYDWYASLSPGNEQSVFWGSAAAGQEGSRNYPGIENPAVDAMIAELLAARSREEFVAAVRALDRLLLAGDYVIPLFFLPRQWIARWRHIGRPDRQPLDGYALDTWWYKGSGGTR